MNCILYIKNGTIFSQHGTNPIKIFQRKILLYAGIGQSQRIKLRQDIVAWVFEHSIFFLDTEDPGKLPKTAITKVSGFPSLFQQRAAFIGLIRNLVPFTRTQGNL